MSADVSEMSADPRLPIDELQASIDKAAANSATLRAAIEDAEAVQDLLDELVRLRRRLGLTQTDVANRMGVRQPTVSQFENERSDPRLSTLQRYARAVDSQIIMATVNTGAATWGHAPNAYASSIKSTRPAHVDVAQRTLPARWSQSRRGSFTRAA